MPSCTGAPSRRSPAPGRSRRGVGPRTRLPSNAPSLTCDMLAAGGARAEALTAARRAAAYRSADAELYRRTFAEIADAPA